MYWKDKKPVYYLTPQLKTEPLGQKDGCCTLVPLNFETKNVLELGILMWVC